MNPYDVLDIDESASDDEVKAAYKSKAQKMHPDRGGNEEDFKRLTIAYSQLKDREDPVDTMLKDLFAIIIDEQSFRGDLISKATGLVRQSLSALKEKHHRLNREVGRLEKLQGRMDNQLWVDMTGQRIDAQQKALKVAAKNIETAEKLLELLGDYKDLAPDPMWNSASGFGEL